MLILTVQQSNRAYAVAIGLSVPGNRCRCLTALRSTCWLIWQTDAGIRAEQRQQARCSTMPPSTPPSGFFLAEVPRRCAQPLTVSFEYERPRRARTAVTDYQQTVRMFVTVLDPKLSLLFNIRIMLLICYLAILSRGVNRPQKTLQLLIWNGAFSLFSFLVFHSRVLCLGWAKRASFAIAVLLLFSAWSIWLQSVLAGFVALLWHLFQPQFILFHAPHFLFNQILECPTIKCNYFTSLRASNLLSQSWKANFKFPCCV